MKNNNSGWVQQLRKDAEDEILYTKLEGFAQAQYENSIYSNSQIARDFSCIHQRSGYIGQA